MMSMRVFSSTVKDHFERSEKGQIWLFCYFLPIFSKTVLLLFFISCIQLLEDDIDQLSRDGFD